MKYPRTYHLPWSPGVSRDDKIQYDLSHINNKLVVITEKMDGENTTMTSDNIYARSPDSKDHQSRHFVKGIWGIIKHHIPKGMRIHGENMYAKHSIYYDNLSSYFLVFSISQNDIILKWNDTKEIINSFNLYLPENMKIQMVPVFYIDTFDESKIQNIDISNQEGYVVRLFDQFDIKDFKYYVLKWVRKDHVKTDVHWSIRWIPNKLKK